MSRNDCPNSSDSSDVRDLDPIPAMQVWVHIYTLLTAVGLAIGAWLLPLLSAMACSVSTPVTLAGVVPVVAA